MNKYIHKLQSEENSEYIFCNYESCTNILIDNFKIILIYLNKYKNNKIFINLPIIEETEYTKISKFLNLIIKYTNLEIIINDYWILQYLEKNNFKPYIWRILWFQLLWSFNINKKLPANILENCKWFFIDDLISSRLNYKEFNNYILDKEIYNIWLNNLYAFSLECKYKRFYDKCNMQCERTSNVDFLKDELVLDGKNLYKKL